MVLPIPGTYVSEDKNFRIRLNGATASKGQMKGAYEAMYSPVGNLMKDGIIGEYIWVNSKEAGKPRVAPFLLHFTIIDRPGEWEYAVRDTWVGVYQKDNKMLLTGTRAYVNEEGVTQSICLGTQVFAM